MNRIFGPMLEVARIQSEINRLFDNLLDVRGGPSETGSWIPNADIVESEEGVVVQVELPGVEASDVSLSVNGDTILLQGDKRRAHPGSPARFHVAERPFGRFRRVIHLGVAVNTHRAEAILKDGLLRIRFPKVPNRRGEEVGIEVRTA